MKTDERQFSVSADAIWVDGNVGEQWFVIDLRSGDEYRRGHIPGALHVPSSELADHDVRIKLAAGGRPIACVCSPDEDFECGPAQFDYLGARVIRILEGGVSAWFERGFPLVPAQFGARQGGPWWPGAHAGSALMLGGLLLGAVVWPGFLLMSAVGWALQSGRDESPRRPIEITNARS